ncbi:Sorting nexin-20 [Heterocephalus glaber]|uniref:Sorting nexin-20 n=1 Tax=Heterocephalus glaber TaxID=10181 RepID=G5C250_HETGA|nr:Sorting nexin-20 [Heterocephalus glaber]
MASAEHPGSPGWTGSMTQGMARTKQEAPTTGPDLPRPEPEGYLGGPSGQSSNSSMTTRELQEYWRSEKGHWKPVKLLFEIASARIEQRRVSKFVMYQIVVIQTGSFDSNKAVLERRYSDFEKLQKSLLKSYREEIEDVVFPGKRLTGNFSEEMIGERRLALREYLRLLYAIRAYARALDTLLRVVPLLERLTVHCPAAPVPALCAVFVCYRDLERPAEAFAAGERALRCLQARESHRYYVPLLEAMVRLAYSLGKDFASLQGRLEESQLHRPSHRGFSLKELSVREYLS